MIEISGLEVRFGGVRAISDLTAKLESSITGLIGPNGAGKTTMLNVLSGFLAPTAGSIKLNGRDIKEVPVHKRSAFGIRRTFQQEQVVLNLSVRDNVAGMLDHVPAGNKPRAEAIRSALEYTRLAGKQHLLGGQLAASDRRMVEIARCIVGEPKLIMMDEPGAGLSDSEADTLREVILGIPAYCNAQVLLVDHDVDLISDTCETTLVLDFGSMIAFGPVKTVMTDPKVRAAYLGEAE